MPTHTVLLRLPGWLIAVVALLPRRQRSELATCPDVTCRWRVVASVWHQSAGEWRLLALRRAGELTRLQERIAQLEAGYGRTHST